MKKKVSFWLGWFSCWDHLGSSFIICECLWMFFVVDVFFSSSLFLILWVTYHLRWAPPPSKKIKRRPWWASSSSHLPDGLLPPWARWCCLHLLPHRAFHAKYPEGRSFRGDHPVVVPWQRDDGGRTRAPCQTGTFSSPHHLLIASH